MTAALWKTLGVWCCKADKVTVSLDVNTIRDLRGINPIWVSRSADQAASKSIKKKKIRETIPTQLAIPGPCGLHSIGKTASVFGLQAHTMRTFPVEEELGGKSSYFACVSHVRSLGWVLAAGVALRHLAQRSVFLTIRWHRQVVSRLLWRTWESLLRAGSLCLS